MKKKVFLFAILLLSGCSKGPLNEPMSISADEVDAYMQENKDATYLDVRSEEEYQFGHVKGFKNVEADKVLDYAKENVDKTDKIIVISRSGTESKQVAEELVANDYQDVVNVDNGYINYPQK